MALLLCRPKQKTLLNNDKQKWAACQSQLVHVTCKFGWKRYCGKHNFLCLANCSCFKAALWNWALELHRGQRGQSLHCPRSLALVPLQNLSIDCEISKWNCRLQHEIENGLPLMKVKARAQFHGSAYRRILHLRPRFPTYVRAPNFCTSLVSIECLVSWSTHAQKPKFAANPWDTLTVCTEFQAPILCLR